MKKVTSKDLENLRKASPSERREITKAHFGLFFAWYLPHYVQYPFAGYHYEMMKDAHDLIAGDIVELAWIQFRESAKTSFAKALILYLLCFDLDSYINVDSYEKENSERILYDVVWELQTNGRIIKDFGNIYNIPKRSKEMVAQKRVNNFVTEPFYANDGTITKPGIRVEAHSTQEPVRGRLHGAKRPGLIILDDFEVFKTIKSEVYTNNIHSHIQEFKGGIDSTRGRILYLGNYLSEFANVQSIIDRSKVDNKLRVRIVPIADDEGKPTWPEKYVMLDKEVVEDKVSVEAVKRRMWTSENDNADFMAEMMCRPIDYAHSDFKKEWFENRFIGEDLRGLRLNTFITFDNAPSTNEFTDWIGCAVVSVDVQDYWYLRYCKRYKLNTPDLVDEIFRLYNVFEPQTIGIEQKAFEDLIKPYIEKKSKELQIYPYVVELKDKGRRKEDRIRGRLQGRFKNGMIKLLRYATDDTPALVQELAQLPNGKHDDLADALQYVAEIAYAPEKALKERPVTPAEYAREDIKSAYEDYRGARRNEGLRDVI